LILPVGGKSSEDRAGELLADVKTLSRRPSRRAGSASRWIHSWRRNSPQPFRGTIVARSSPSRP